MICETCKQDASSTCNGECWGCHVVTQKKWHAKMAIRQDAKQFDAQRLVNLLLTQHWMHECKIVPDYMPPFPSSTTRPTCQVWFTYPDGSRNGLRYSNGPLQGYFWDVYGDDMHSPELALIALANAPPPPRVDVCIPTHGH